MVRPLARSRRPRLHGPLLFLTEEVYQPRRSGKLAQFVERCQYSGCPPCRHISALCRSYRSGRCLDRSGVCQQSPPPGLQLSRRRPVASRLCVADRRDRRRTQPSRGPAGRRPAEI